MFSPPTASPTPDKGAAVSGARLEQELTYQFFVQAHTTSLTGLSGMLVYALIILPHHHGFGPVLWFSLMAFHFFLRYLWTGKVIQDGVDTCNKPRNNYLLSFIVVAAGVSWGFASWAFTWPDIMQWQLPALLLLMGILSMTPPILSARPLIGLLFSLTMLAGIIARIHVEVPTIFLHTTLMVLFIAFFPMVIAYRHYFNLRKATSLRLEKDEMFEKMARDKQKAEETARAKSAFVATVSHEIRTPVNGLMGMLEILKETELTTTQANYLNTASRSAESLLQLLNDILDYSKIEVGKLELEKVPFDWIAMVGEIAMMNRVLASNKGVAFHLDIPPESKSIVIGDPTRLRQILNNLLSNALKFTSEGSISLKVTIDSLDKTTTRLSFSVSDTGIGIEEAVQHKLFQQFQQASASTSRRYGGSGLGLAISQHLARLMGGEITLSSVPGMGSNFTLIVPFPTASPEAMLAYVTTNSGENKRFCAKVLVVEDDPISQRVAVLMLKGFGITPTVVNTGEAALDRAKQERFDLIFMDSHLPDQDGFGAAAAIRDLFRDSKTPAPVIVAMSGADSPEDRKRAHECGIHEFLPKPVRKREMRQCLERWYAAAVKKAPATQPSGSDKA
jgi:signal transduction histidine kinase/CheY-like chemotaxis protein